MQARSLLKKTSNIDSLRLKLKPYRIPRLSHVYNRQKESVQYDFDVNDVLFPYSTDITPSILNISKKMEENRWILAKEMMPEVLEDKGNLLLSHLYTGIRLYAKLDDVDGIKGIINLMDNAHDHNVLLQMNDDVLSVLIKVFGDLGKVDHIEDFFDYMVKNYNIKPSQDHLSFLINAFLENNEIEKAADIYEIVKEKETETNMNVVDSIVKFKYHLGETEEIENIFENLLDNSLLPNVGCFNTVIQIKGRRSLSEALSVYSQMKNYYKVNPTFETERIMFNLLDENQYIFEARSILLRLAQDGKNSQLHELLLERSLEHEKYHEGLATFAVMVKKGIIPSLKGYNVLFNILHRLGRIEDILQIANHLQDNSVQLSADLINTLKIAIPDQSLNQSLD
eukprot:TRINITY_DN2580_c0_g3_i1.p1 TRINITY_DN2580_c0_g3~~TRINITY_DN2580_c0_g3_i1.p1  ORF type:complete len:396 (-),score=77.66 TRINITY_DN2580_c0_g3_i1:51-1238(-)